MGYASTKQALQRSDENVKLSLAVFGDLFDKLSPDEGFFPPPTGRRDRRRFPPAGFGRGRHPDGDAEIGGPGDAQAAAEPRDGDGPEHGPPFGARSERFGRGSRPAPQVGPGGNPFASDGPMAGERGMFPRVGDAGAGTSKAPALAVLNFYEQFAHRNETNSRLQNEAARAYFRVGSLLERLDRFEEADRAMGRAPCGRDI